MWRRRHYLGRRPNVPVIIVSTTMRIFIVQDNYTGHLFHDVELAIVAFAQFDAAGRNLADLEEVVLDSSSRKSDHKKGYGKQ